MGMCRAGQIWQRRVLCRGEGQRSRAANRQRGLERPFDRLLELFLAPPSPPLHVEAAFKSFDTWLTCLHLTKTIVDALKLKVEKDDQKSDSHSSVMVNC